MWIADYNEKGIEECKKMARKFKLTMSDAIISKINDSCCLITKRDIKYTIPDRKNNG